MKTIRFIFAGLAYVISLPITFVLLIWHFGKAGADSFFEKLGTDLKIND